ncbi:MAG: hypothetical protein KKE81_06025, partial [Candidatus Omnitrophica bacterium]|nr:hypothetical protein [Candidatus Omnitrophota bacterium]
MGTDFQRLAARFVGAAVGAASRDLVPLIFSSSVSVRSPDASNLWHSGYRQRHLFKLFFQLLIASVTGLLKGLMRTLRPPRFGYGLYGTIKDSILIVTSECGYAAAGDSYKTKYVDTDDDDAMLVVGPVQQCGSRAKLFIPISALASLRIVCIMTVCGIYAFFKIRGSIVSRALILLEWYSWVFSLQWQRN